MDGYDEVYRVACAGTVAFVALHAVLGGRAFGGIRIRAYATEEAALDDALLLARAMSRKVVMAGLPAGGAKSVLVEPRSDRAAAVAALGAFIDSLGGRYHCGPDLGFTEEDGAALSAETSFLACGALGDVTARGVHAAVRAVASPRSAAVQGLGAVGLPLARLLLRDGVRVTVSDLRPVADLPTVAPEEIYDVEADLFAPCAAGGVLDTETISRLRCRVVCGGANNPLADESGAELLRARGILYVPDFLSNAGAVIDGGARALGEADRVEELLGGLGDRVREVVARAEAEGRTPLSVAVEEADRRIEALRSRRN